MIFVVLNLRNLLLVLDGFDLTTVLKPYSKEKQQSRDSNPGLLISMNFLCGEMQKIGFESRLGSKNRDRTSDSPKRNKKFVFRRNRNETKFSVLQKKSEAGSDSETETETSNPSKK